MHSNVQIFTSHARRCALHSFAETQDIVRRLLHWRLYSCGLRMRKGPWHTYETLKKFNTA